MIQAARLNIEKQIIELAPLLGVSPTYLMFALEFLSNNDELAKEDLDYDIMLYYLKSIQGLEFKKASKNLKVSNDKDFAHAKYLMSRLSEAEYNALALKLSPSAFELLNQYKNPLVCHAVCIQLANQEMHSAIKKCHPLSFTQAVVKDCKDELTLFKNRK